MISVASRRSPGQYDLRPDVPPALVRADGPVVAGDQQDPTDKGENRE